MQTIAEVGVSTMISSASNLSGIVPRINARLAPQHLIHSGTISDKFSASEIIVYLNGSLIRPVALGGGPFINV